MKTEKTARQPIHQPIHDPMTVEPPSDTSRTNVTLRLIGKDGHFVDILAKSIAAIRATVVERNGAIFVDAGADHRDGKWVRLFRAVDVVKIA